MLYQPRRHQAAAPGLYKGGLDLTLEDPQPSELDYLVDHNLLPLPLTAGLQELPIAVVSPVPKNEDQQI